MTDAKRMFLTSSLYDSCGLVKHYRNVFTNGVLIKNVILIYMYCIEVLDVLSHFTY